MAALACIFWYYLLILSLSASFWWRIAWSWDSLHALLLMADLDFSLLFGMLINDEWILNGFWMSSNFIKWLKFRYWFSCPANPKVETQLKKSYWGILTKKAVSTISSSLIKKRPATTEADTAEAKKVHLEPAATSSSENGHTKNGN